MGDDIYHTEAQTWRYYELRSVFLKTFHRVQTMNLVDERRCRAEVEELDLCADK